eukprot:2406224-Pleurochrysis_carterae.AAC.1
MRNRALASEGCVPYRLVQRGLRHAPDVVDGLDGGGAHPRESTDGRGGGEHAEDEQVEVVRSARLELVVWRADGAHGDVLVEEKENGKEEGGEGGEQPELDGEREEGQQKRPAERDGADGR